MFRFMICVLLIFIANRHDLFFKGKKGLQLLILKKKKNGEKKQTLIDMKYLKIKAVIFKID